MGGYIDDGTLKLDDALKSIIVLENKINLDVRNLLFLKYYI